MRSGVYWIIARVCIYVTRGGRGRGSELCSLSANGLWHLLEVQKGCSRITSFQSRCAGLSLFHLYPVNGRSLSADTLVGSQEFTTKGDDGAVTITGDNFLHRYQIL